MGAPGWVHRVGVVCASRSGLPGKAGNMHGAAACTTQAGRGQACRARRQAGGCRTGRYAQRLQLPRKHAALPPGPAGSSRQQCTTAHERASGVTVDIKINLVLNALEQVQEGGMVFQGVGRRRGCRAQQPLCHLGQQRQPVVRRQAAEQGVPLAVKLLIQLIMLIQAGR